MEWPGIILRMRVLNTFEGFTLLPGFHRFRWLFGHLLDAVVGAELLCLMSVYGFITSECQALTWSLEAGFSPLTHRKLCPVFPILLDKCHHHRWHLQLSQECNLHTDYSLGMVLACRCALAGEQGLGGWTLGPTMPSAASKVIGGGSLGTREKPTVRASSKRQFDGSVHNPAPVVEHPSNAWGVKGRYTGALLLISTRETAQSVFLYQSENRKQMAHSN